MATALFLIGFLGLMVFPSKYISIGGYSFLFSALAVSLLMIEGKDAFHQWSFWLIVVLALGCTGYWLKQYSDKKKHYRLEEELFNRGGF